MDYKQALTRSFEWDNLKYFYAIYAIAAVAVLVTIAPVLASTQNFFSTLSINSLKDLVTQSLTALFGLCAVTLLVITGFSVLKAALIEKFLSKKQITLKKAFELAQPNLFAFLIVLLIATVTTLLVTEALNYFSDVAASLLGLVLNSYFLFTVYYALTAKKPGVANALRQSHEFALQKPFFVLKALAVSRIAGLALLIITLIPMILVLLLAPRGLIGLASILVAGVIALTGFTAQFILTTIIETQYFQEVVKK